MINGVQNAALNGAFSNNVTKSDVREVAKGSNEPRKVTSQVKTEALKQKIAAGEYKIDLDRVARKMAEELLS